MREVHVESPVIRQQREKVRDLLEVTRDDMIAQGVAMLAQAAALDEEAAKVCGRPDEAYAAVPLYLFVRCISSEFDDVCPPVERTVQDARRYALGVREDT